MSSYHCHLILFFVCTVGSALAVPRHVITIPASVHRPEVLAWDPTAQHFVVGSASNPIIYSVSDAGVAESIVSDPLLPPSCSAASISIDDNRRRLLVAFRSPNAVAAYDLRSRRPHRRLFYSSILASPSGIAVDPVTGLVFVTGSDAGVIWRLDLEGRVSEFSRSAIYSVGKVESPAVDLGAVAHVTKGFLLVVQGATGKTFKVDEDSGSAKEVIGRNGIPAREAEGISMLANGQAVIAGNRFARVVRSDDGWAEATVKEEAKMVEGMKVKGLTVRQGRKAYVLVTRAIEAGVEDGKETLGNRIEEVEWEEEADMVWLMVLLGFGLAYFLYWRFQMRQLVTNMNKKRA
ncbi:hypothetical protein HPP92_008055 [Vanilla planifolia]|uniref:Uncharacterized protein n=1 Tax=Vanilla planifolia TaxID=51239 RepID=A0A835RDR8_VANPL|nr:hypothetical protein HPP92_008055 [Vanilla planifolia]